MMILLGFSLGYLVAVIMEYISVSRKLKKSKQLKKDAMIEFSWNHVHELMQSFNDLKRDLKNRRK